MIEWNKRRFGYPGSILDKKTTSEFFSSIKKNLNSYGMHCARGDHGLHEHRRIEESVINNLVAFLELPKTTLGYVSTGASEAAIMAMWAAQKLGVKAIISSPLAHISLKKAMQIAGLSGLNHTTNSPITPQSLKELIDNKNICGPILLCLTWWNPIYVDTDNILETVKYAKQCKKDIYIYIDGAVGATLDPLLNNLTLKNLDIDILGLDLHKTSGAPIGTGVTLYSQAIRNAISIPEPYLPYGEECTVVGSRNAAAAAASAVCVKNLTNGVLMKRYNDLRQKAQKIISPYSKSIIDNKFPYYLFEIKEGTLSAPTLKKLHDYDIIPWENGGKFLARICLTPGQSMRHLSKALKLLLRPR